MLQLDNKRSRSQSNEIITQNLFRRTQEHHEKCLRKVFLQYYEPLILHNKLVVNEEWTSGLHKKILSDLRLHLTWTLKGEVFHWTDKQIGKKILRIYSNLVKTSSSIFIKHVKKVKL